MARIAAWGRMGYCFGGGACERLLCLFFFLRRSRITVLSVLRVRGGRSDGCVCPGLLAYVPPATVAVPDRIFYSFTLKSVMVVNRILFCSGVGEREKATSDGE